MERQFIVIHGMFHSGTSILKSIIGDHDEVHNVIDETNKTPSINWNRTPNKNFVVFKTPHIQSESKYPKSYKLITIIRNPFFVYNSLLLRFNRNIPKDVNLFQEYEKLVGLQRTKIIKYEDLFTEGFLDQFFNELNLSWSPKILLKKHSIFSNKKKKELGKHRAHNILRENQINENFENKNNPDKLILDMQDVEYIRRYKSLWQDYYCEI